MVVEGGGGGMIISVRVTISITKADIFKLWSGDQQQQVGTW